MVPSGGSGLVSLVQYVLVAPFQVLYHLVLSFFGYGTTNVATHPSRSDGGTDRGNNYISGDSGRFSRQVILRAVLNFKFLFTRFRQKEVAYI